MYHLKRSLPLQILGSYKTDPQMNDMFKRLDFYITPVLNMDGYVYSWKDNTVIIQKASKSLKLLQTLEVAVTY